MKLNELLELVLSEINNIIYNNNSYTYLPTPWSRVLEKLTVSLLVKKFPHFMEPESLL